MIGVLVASLALATSFGDFDWKPVHHRPPRHHHHKKPPKPPPMSSALASYYALHGGGACGVGDVQSGYRFASLIYGCGTRVQMCRSSCVTATMSDRGPYVGGRTFDLNVNLKNALGCPDLCVVRYRVVG
jgi:hypothetical protein